MNRKNLELIAVSVEKLTPVAFMGQDGNPCNSATLRGRSTVDNLSFEIESILRSGDQIADCAALIAHGSTVVEAPSDWRNSWPPHSWHGVVIGRAIERVRKVIEANRGMKTMDGYNSTLADRVLQILSNMFPNTVSRNDLKYELTPEPSDDELSLALEALLIDEHIQGQAIRAGYGNCIVEMLNIRLTAQGRKHLTKSSSYARGSTGDVIYGDQNINFGSAGAVGRDSHGSINCHEQWKQIESDTSLVRLAEELAIVRSEFRKTATSRSDDRDLAYLANAEDFAEAGNGEKTLVALSRVGKSVLNVAKSLGTDVAAKVIAISLGFD